MFHVEQQDELGVLKTISPGQQSTIRFPSVPRGTERLFEPKEYEYRCVFFPKMFHVEREPSEFGKSRQMGLSDFHSSETTFHVKHLASAFELC
jgi:hypothetical protein